MPETPLRTLADYDYSLGSIHRDVTTESVDAQAWFDRGLAWSYAFNFEEGVRCFQRAISHDPDLAIAHWGVAYAAGPNYNKAWRLFDRLDATQTIELATSSLEQAHRLLDRASSSERALIEALPARYPSTIPDDFAPFNRAYADAMRKVYAAAPDDLDVAALFVDSLICVSPRQLWDLPSGEPVGYGTVEARTVLERAFLTPAGLAHPAINHLYIHTMEMAPFPEIAAPAAERLRDSMRDAGHMAHMATHIDISTGHYGRAVDSGTVAAAANDHYLETETGIRFYHLYRAHDLYVKVYAAMLAGRSADAEHAARRIIEVLPADLLRLTTPPMADWVESHVSALPHVMIRFGRWEEIIALPLPEDRELFCVTTAMTLYAQGIAYAALGRIDDAARSQAEFRVAAAAVPASRMALPNREIDVLQVAEAMLAGELEYRRGNFEEAFAQLRLGIEREDALLYADPRSWLQPVRHAYGALLLEQGRIEEAEANYRSDLGLDGKLPHAKTHPKNVWSLHGLHECLTRLGRDAEAAEIAAQRDIALSDADVLIAASCYCRLSASGESSCSCDHSSGAGCTCGAMDSHAGHDSHGDGHDSHGHGHGHSSDTGSDAE